MLGLELGLEGLGLGSSVCGDMSLVVSCLGSVWVRVRIRVSVSVRVRVSVRGFRVKVGLGLGFVCQV